MWASCPLIFSKLQESWSEVSHAIREMVTVFSMNSFKKTVVGQNGCWSELLKFKNNLRIMQGSSFIKAEHSVYCKRSIKPPGAYFFLWSWRETYWRGGHI